MHTPPGLRRAGFLTLVFSVLLGFSAARVAAEPKPVPAEAHQFDFWLGEWTVTDADGTFQGTNVIEPILGGRGLLEHWEGDHAAGNGSGKSLNAWNAVRKQWQQFWIGSDGVVIELTGGLDEAGRMVLRGERETGGRRVLDRLTWTPNSDGTVRQLWDQSSDGGATWKVVFDGRYTRKR